DPQGARAPPGSRPRPLDGRGGGRRRGRRLGCRPPCGHKAIFIWSPRLQAGEPPVSRSSYIFTSESVSEGHPDKVADRISDTVVDAFLNRWPEARVACETLVTTNRIVLAGEVRGGSEAETAEVVDSLEP